MNKKEIILRTDGTIPFAWWIDENGTPAKVIVPPKEFTVRAYKNYCADIIKKYRLKMSIVFKKGAYDTILYSIDNGPWETITRPEITLDHEKKIRD